MQSQTVTTVAVITRHHAKPLDARNASYQQVQQVLHSNLYHQTGHYATPKEVGVFMIVAIVAIVLLLLRAVLS